MPMCAIYTAVAPAPPHELATIARANDAAVYRGRRHTMGRHAIAELVAAVAPSTHAGFARTVLVRDMWGFLTPAAARGNHAAAMQDVHVDLTVPVPLWPSSTELACLVGVEPAQYLGNNVAALPPELVDVAVVAFTEHEGKSEAARYLNGFLRLARDARHVVLLHWDYR